MTMQASRSLLWYVTIFLTSVPYAAASDTIEPLSFAIITSNQYVAPVDASSSSSLRMTLTWDSSSYECVTQLSSTSHIHQCDIQASTSTPVAPFVTNHARMLQIESGDDIAIHEIIVLDANHNNYTVTTFCTGNESDECHFVVTVRSANIRLLSQKAIVHHNNQTHELNQLIQPAVSISRRQLVEVGADNHDIAYFTLQISSTEGSGILNTTSFFLQADVYWGVYWFQCTYGIPFPDGARLECHPNLTSTYQTTPTFTDGSNSIYPLEDSYRFHFSQAYADGGGDFVRIASITVHTNNGNFYVIDEFCSPRQFNTSNTPMSDTFCVEYPHKYLSDELEVSFVYNSVVDVEFLDAIRFAESQAERSSYANQAHVGNAKAPVIEQFTIKFNQSAVADVTLPEYTLYFDEYIYACLGEDSSANSVPLPNQVTCNAAKTGYSRTECDHDSQFRLHIFNNGDSSFSSHSPLIIDEIDITTGSQLQIHHMDRFCIADADTRIQAASTETGATCASSAFADGDTLTEWSQVCVGDGLSQDDPDSCSETAIDIFFPDDLFAYADYPVPRAMEGKVVYSSGRLVERTCVPTNEPTSKPTVSPTAAPTQSPTEVPTSLPTATPTAAPTDSPTVSPTGAPTFSPTFSPTSAPSFLPTAAPTELPTDGPTNQPTVDPSVAPSDSPTTTTFKPTTSDPTVPTSTPTSSPTPKPLASDVSPIASTIRTVTITTDVGNPGGAQPLSAEFKSWVVVFSCSFGVCFCFCCIAAGIVYKYRQRKRGNAPPQRQPSQPQPQAPHAHDDDNAGAGQIENPDVSALLAMARVVPHSASQVVAPGAANDNDKRKQGEADIELEEARVPKHHAQFVFYPNMNESRHTAKDSLGSHSGDEDTTPPNTSSAGNWHWYCALCSLKNENDMDRCEMCDAPKDGLTADGAHYTAKGDDEEKDTWQCTLCQFENGNQIMERCKSCEAPKHGVTVNPAYYTAKDDGEDGEDGEGDDYDNSGASLESILIAKGLKSVYQKLAQHKITDEEEFMHLSEKEIEDLCGDKCLKLSLLEKLKFKGVIRSIWKRREQERYRQSIINNQRKKSK